MDEDRLMTFGSLTPVRTEYREGVSMEFSAVPVATFQPLDATKQLDSWVGASPAYRSGPPDYVQRAVRTTREMWETLEALGVVDREDLRPSERGKSQPFGRGVSNVDMVVFDEAYKMMTNPPSSQQGRFQNLDWDDA